MRFANKSFRLWERAVWFSSRNATSSGRDKNLSNAFNFYVKSRETTKVNAYLRERFGSSFKNSVFVVEK